VSTVATARPIRSAWRNVLRAKLALVDRRRYESLQIEHVEGLPFVVLPDVFNPALLRSGAFLAEEVQRIAPSSHVLEMGCGAGAASVLAASHGCQVTAVDVNPSAVRCAKINALLNDVEISVRHGDLFAPVHSERFDVVLFNPPYYRGEPSDALDRAWRSPDVMERFAAELQDHLTPDGYAFVVLSSDGEREAFVANWRAAGLQSAVVRTRDLINETLFIYRVTARC
jgi:HemK-related putative methylase